MRRPTLVHRSGSAPRWLQRLGGWPRKVAAVACLVLAGASALSGGRHPASAAPRPVGLSARLRTDQVAVPVAVTASGPWIRPGERIGLLAGPSDSVTGGSVSLDPDETSAALLADGLRVLSERTDDSMAGTGTTVFVVAAARSDALRIAAATGRAIMPVLDNSP